VYCVTRSRTHRDHVWPSAFTFPTYPKLSSAAEYRLR
jgi:hypothetical protein